MTKNVEDLLVPEQVGEAMRRAYSLLKNGRSGPVMLELPDRRGLGRSGRSLEGVSPVRAARSPLPRDDVDDAPERW